MGRRDAMGDGKLVPRLLALGGSLTFLAYAWSFQRYSSKVFSFLWEEHGYAAEVAGRVETALVAFLCVAAIGVWLERFRWLSLLGVAALLLEMLAASFMPSAKYPYLYWAEWALRYATPVLLLLYLQAGAKARGWSVWGMKVAVGLVFAAHGVKALLSDPFFIDLILGSGRRIGFEWEERQAVGLLHVIGLSDLSLALLALWFQGPRIRFVLTIAAAWGAVTAFSRVTYGGWGNGYEVLVRSTHFIVPMVLLLLLRRRQTQPGRLRNVKPQMAQIDRVERT